MGIVTTIAFFLRAFLVPRAVLAAESLALRQQIAVLQVLVKRPQLRTRDRIFWVWPARFWLDSQQHHSGLIGYSNRLIRQQVLAPIILTLCPSTSAQ
jgi:hypothetical protein